VIWILGFLGGCIVGVGFLLDSLGGGFFVWFLLFGFFVLCLLAGV